MKIIDLTGQRFGRLTVIEEYGRDNNGSKTYKCICDCGHPVIVCSYALRKGQTQSCGCLQRERTSEANTIHGDCRRKKETSLHRRYKHMLQRCNNPNNKDYNNYGGRGISVCQEWTNNYEEFKRWALQNGYREELTIDRINVNGNYEPDNCRWITLQEQENNRRDNVFLTYQGMTKTASQWARLLNVKPSKILDLKRKGKGDEEILNHFSQIEEVLEQMREDKK